MSVGAEIFTSDEEMKEALAEVRAKMETSEKTQNKSSMENLMSTRDKIDACKAFFREMFPDFYEKMFPEETLNLMKRNIQKELFDSLKEEKDLPEIYVVYNVVFKYICGNNLKNYFEIAVPVKRPENFNLTEYLENEIQKQYGCKPAAYSYMKETLGPKKIAEFLKQVNNVTELINIDIGHLKSEFAKLRYLVLPVTDSVEQRTKDEWGKHFDCPGKIV